MCAELRYEITTSNKQKMSRTWMDKGGLTYDKRTSNRKIEK